MARTILAGKTILVAGADTTLGRAIALQLSRAGCRLGLFGIDEGALSKLADLIAKKDGDAGEIPGSPDGSDWPEMLRVGCETAGHFHAIVNVTAFLADHQVARTFRSHSREMMKERGFTRYLHILPADAPAFDTDPKAWESVVRIGELLPEGAEEKGGMRPGSVGDAVTYLLQLPPGACPRTVLLESPQGAVGPRDR